MISVSIIIPAWNEETTLHATLQALLYIDYDKSKCEIIIVAGGGDRTYEIARSPFPGQEAFSRYIVLRQEPHGKNAAIQRGIKEAKNDIIVLLDADTIVTERWLKNMVWPIETGDAELTIANPYPIRRNWVSDYYMIIKTYLLNDISTFSGHAIGFRANTVEKKLEYFFDRSVKVGVDYLLMTRFLEHGLKIAFISNARVVTYLPYSLKYFLRTEMRWLTAYMNIKGVSYKALFCNAAVVGSLIFAIPFFGILSVLSLLFSVVYVGKRSRIFLVARREYRTEVTNIFGFVLLSYFYHAISLCSSVKHFLGLSRLDRLSQGQR